MQQISYSDVAEVIARAETPEEREDAHLLLAAYYRLSPVVEPVSMRRQVLLCELQAATARQGG